MYENVSISDTVKTSYPRPIQTISPKPLYPHFFLRLQSGSKKLSGSFISPLLRPGDCFISSKDSRENFCFDSEPGAGAGVEVTGGRMDAPKAADTASPLKLVVP